MNYFIHYLYWSIYNLNYGPIISAHFLLKTGGVQKHEIEIRHVASDEKWLKYITETAFRPSERSNDETRERALLFLKYTECLLFIQDRPRSDQCLVCQEDFKDGDQGFNGLENGLKPALLK